MSVSNYKSLEIIDVLYIKYVVIKKIVRIVDEILESANQRWMTTGLFIVQWLVEPEEYHYAAESSF